MKTRNYQPPAVAPGESAGFTMIEVALALGIIAFALVAIIGVLPSGLKVQRENREETIINQDGLYLLEAIRSGSRGADDLTNNVEWIEVAARPGSQVTDYATSQRYAQDTDHRTHHRESLTNGLQIISLLSTPKVDPRYLTLTNVITARVRAIGGSAIEKGRAMDDFAFRYLITSEVIPMTNLPPQAAFLLQGTDANHMTNLYQNLYEVRLTLRWPLLQRGTTWSVGRYRKTLRTLVSGQLTSIWTNKAPQYPIRMHQFEPDIMLSAH